LEGQHFLFIMTEVELYLSKSSVSGIS